MPIVMDQDEDHLRLLSLFHYVVGGLTMLFALIPLIHVVIGASLLHGAKFMELKTEQSAPASVGPVLSETGREPAVARGSLAVQSDVPEILAWFFVAVGSTLVLLGEALGICLIVAGCALARRRRYLFVFVLACVQCVVFPFGTALGVFTLIVLSRPAVKARFAAPPPLLAPA